MAFPMSDDSNSVNNLLRQIQSLSSFFYAFYNTNTLLIMLEPKRTDLVERPLSGMTKRGMPKVMSETDGFCQIFI